MAVSSSTDFSTTATELIKDARALCGILAEEEPLDATETERGLRTLTRMLKAWEVDGIGSWILTEGSLTLVDSDGSYSFESGGDFTTVPFEITQVRVSHDGGNEIEMTPMSREEYYRLPSRTTEGFPTQYYYDRQRDSGTLYIWPEPDDSLYDLTFTYRRRIMDMDSGSDNFDLPPEWEEALVYNLAKRFIPIYGVSEKERLAEIREGAAVSYAVIRNWDIGEGGGSVFILPEGR